MSTPNSNGKCRLCCQKIRTAIIGRLPRLNRTVSDLMYALTIATCVFVMVDDTLTPILSRYGIGYCFTYLIAIIGGATLFLRQGILLARELLKNNKHLKVIRLFRITQAVLKVIIITLLLAVFFMELPGPVAFVRPRQDLLSSVSFLGEWLISNAGRRAEWIPFLSVAPLIAFSLFFTLLDDWLIMPSRLAVSAHANQPKIKDKAYWGIICKMVTFVISLGYVMFLATFASFIYCYVNI